MEHLYVIIDEIFDGDIDALEQRDNWRNMIAEYSAAMQILRKRSEYTDNDIEQFQYLIDNFFEKYVKETGCEGITNYIHMLASAHIKHYMVIHRNLYKYSQQGWESLNSKYKQVFFRHTQRGGNYGIATEESERTYMHFKERCCGFQVMLNYTFTMLVLISKLSNTIKTSFNQSFK